MLISDGGLAILIALDDISNGSVITNILLAQNAIRDNMQLPLKVGGYIMNDHVPYVETSLEILNHLINGYKKRELLDYAASLEFVRDQIAEHHVKRLYVKADDLIKSDQLAV
ncbi:MAG: hypothetical protein AAGC58_12750 [Asticcacaulis sp.]